MESYEEIGFGGDRLLDQDDKLDKIVFSVVLLIAVLAIMFSI